ncbi:MAG: universal stress protein [Rhizobiaceae bacterium]|nr:universal stress protein [Rhizobiaceae bacterium]
MTFKTIAVILQTVEETDRVLDFLLPVAAAWQAHIVGIHAEPLPVDYSSGIGFPDVGVIQAATEAAAQRTAAVAGAFAARMGSDQSHEWQSHSNMTGDSAYGALSLARCADLVVVAQRDPHSPSGDGANLDSAIYESGRPVLVVPHDGALVGTFARVLVSWNGSREAARAAFDALPLIEAAETVEILTVDPEAHPGSTESAAALAGALSRHGASVTVTTSQSGGSSVDEIVQGRVAETGADLVVLGAYSHSWLRELLFGGVTRSVLQSMPIATFVSR